MPRVADLVNRYQADKPARRVANQPSSTVARLVASYEDVSRDDADGLQVDGSVETCSNDSGDIPRERTESVPEPVEVSRHQYPKVNKPSLYASSAKLNPQNTRATPAATPAPAYAPTPAPSRVPAPAPTFPSVPDAAEAPSPPPAPPAPMPPTEHVVFPAPSVSTRKTRESGHESDQVQRKSSRSSAREETSTRPTSRKSQQRVEEERRDRRVGSDSGAASSSGHPYVVREPSNSSTIRSNRSQGSSTSGSPTPGEHGIPVDDDEFLVSNSASGANIPPAPRSNRLPRAKVVTARRRPMSQSVEMDLTPLGDGPISIANEAASAPVLPTLAPEFSTGRVSLVNLMETNETTILRHDDPDFDRVQDAAFDAAVAAAASNKRPAIIDPAADPYHNPSLLDQNGRGGDSGFEGTKGKRRGLFRRSAPKDSRNGARDEDVQRRATMVSGAIDRLSVRVDPYVDFLANGAGPATTGGRAVKKNRFSRMMRRIFGQNDRKLISR